MVRGSILVIVLEVARIAVRVRGLVAPYGRGRARSGAEKHDVVHEVRCACVHDHPLSFTLYRVTLHVFPKISQ